VMTRWWFPKDPGGQALVQRRAVSMAWTSGWVAWYSPPSDGGAHR
jgi:hypothetical protein